MTVSELCLIDSGGGINSADAIMQGAAFDEFSITVSNATVSEIPSAVWKSNALVRKNRSIFDDLKAKFFVDEIILVKERFGGFGIVEIIKIYQM